MVEEEAASINILQSREMKKDKAKKQDRNWGKGTKGLGEKSWIENLSPEIVRSEER